MVEEGVVSTRGLKPDAYVFDELVFDVNTDYFETHGGYEYAKQFYAEVYELAKEIAGGEQYIISAVMHADERNREASDRLGRDVFHYHTIARTFGMLDSSGGLLCEAYLRMGDKQKAAESFAQYVEELTGPAPVPDKILFSPAITVKDRSEVAQAASREMRQMLLDGIVKDEKYAALASNPIFARALEKLKASLL